MNPKNFTLIVFILLAFLMLTLTGCGNVKRMWSGITGKPEEYCHKGVSYLQFPSGATVEYEPKGNIKNCK